MTHHKYQHWVPRSYIEAWADPETPANHDPYVHIFTRTGQALKKRSPSKILHKANLYTIFKGASRDLRIEQLFGEWETAFSRARKKLESGIPPSEADVANLYVFTAALMVRPPHYIEHFASQWRNFAAQARTIRIKPGAKPLPSLEKGPSMSLEHAERFGSDPMGTWFLRSVQASIEVLARCFGLSLVVNNSEHPFLTSDAPAVTYHSRDAEHPRVIPRGLGWPGCEVTLPISPGLALLFSHRPYGLHEIEAADWERVFEINFRTITKAKELVIADRPDLFFVRAIFERVAEVEATKREQET